MRYLILLLVFILGCSSIKKVKKTDEPEVTIMNETFTAPKLLIYKTKKDYSNLVPISLSNDKKTIISFPHPSDLIIEGKLAYPVKLPEGYLLDVKGIDQNVAFIKITYEEYNKLANPPTIEQLKELIEDDDPLLELWDCGLKLNEPGEIQKITKWIVSGKIADLGTRIK